jgi:hypothetical protein
VWAGMVHTIAWPSSLIAEGVICATVAGVAGGVIGGFIGRAVTEGQPTERIPRWVVPAAAVAAVAVMAWAIPMPNGKPPKATIALTNAGSSGGQRQVYVTAKLDPPSAADNPRWFVVTAWQGGGSVVADMKKIGPGTYRSEKPIPVGGQDWKSTLRLQSGRAVLGTPIYMPADSAIPVKAVPAPQGSETRAFVRDKQLLQREQKKGVSGVLTSAAYIGVLLIWSTMIAVVAWGLSRLSRALGSSPKPRQPSGERTPSRTRPTTRRPTAA